MRRRPARPSPRSRSRQPPVKYEGCVVSNSPNAAAAAAFLKNLTTKPVQATFKADGFLLPKKPAVIVKAKPKKKK